MHQVFIQMKTEHGCFFLFPGDLSLYTFKCICCCQSITAPGSIGEALYHVRIEMLCHWSMIDTLDPPGEFDIASIPLLFTSWDSYQQALASFKGTLPGSYEDNVELDVLCKDPKLKRHHKLCFCDAVKVDSLKMNESYYQEIFYEYLSLSTVVFGDFGAAVDIHRKAKDTDNTHLISYLILLNDAFVFDKGLIEDEYYNPLQKECLKSFESFCVFDYHKYYNTFVVHLVGIL